MATAAVVRHFRLDGVPGEYFVCDRYRAQMSVAACAGMYNGAKRAREPRHPNCRGCPVGARHAGDKHADRGKSVFHSRLCARCNEPASRLLYDGSLCISCVNRQLERIRGRNAKGRFPIHAPVTHRLSCRVVAKARTEIYQFGHVTGMLEAVFRVLHAQPEDILFVRHPHGVPPAGGQQRLCAPVRLVLAPR